MMFWEGSGIGSEVIGFLQYFVSLGMHHRVISSTLFSSFLVVYSFHVSNIQAIQNIGSGVYDHTHIHQGTLFVFG